MCQSVVCTPTKNSIKNETSSHSGCVAENWSFDIFNRFWYHLCSLISCSLQKKKKKKLNRILTKPRWKLITSFKHKKCLILIISIFSSFLFHFIWLASNLVHRHLENLSVVQTKTYSEMIRFDIKIRPSQQKINLVNLFVVVFFFHS